MTDVLFEPISEASLLEGPIEDPRLFETGLEAGFAEIEGDTGVIVLVAFTGTTEFRVLASVFLKTLDLAAYPVPLVGWVSLNTAAVYNLPLLCDL